MGLWDLSAAALTTVKTIFLRTPFFLTKSLTVTIGLLQKACLASSEVSLVGLPLRDLSSIQAVTDPAGNGLADIYDNVVHLAGSTREAHIFLPRGLDLN